MMNLLDELMPKFFLFDAYKSISDYITDRIKNII
jgi:hypothetical protein